MHRQVVGAAGDVRVDRADVQVGNVGAVGAVQVGVEEQRAALGETAVSETS